MFLDRAVAARGDFRLTTGNVGPVVDICRRLDGIPLALELAAARVRLLSVEHIVERLDERLDLLTGGSRTAPPRQQTLRATLDWSYGLLSEAEARSAAAVVGLRWRLDASCRRGHMCGRWD